MAVFVTVPPNTAATIHFPGNLVTENGKRVTVGNGINQLDRSGDRLIAQVGSGEYCFRVLLNE